MGQHLKFTISYTTVDGDEHQNVGFFTHHMAKTIEDCANVVRNLAERFGIEKETIKVHKREVIENSRACGFIRPIPGSGWWY